MEGAWPYFLQSRPPIEDDPDGGMESQGRSFAAKLLDAPMPTDRDTYKKICAMWTKLRAAFADNAVDEGMGTKKDQGAVKSQVMDLQ